MQIKPCFETPSDETRKGNCCIIQGGKKSICFPLLVMSKGLIVLPWFSEVLTVWIRIFYSSAEALNCQQSCQLWEADELEARAQMCHVLGTDVVL